MKKDELNKSEKVLLAIYELDKSNKKKITVEDVAVKLWRMWPSEFCMRGYPNYPNNDIQKHITKPLDNNWITGGVYGYKFTEKGRNYVKQLKGIKTKKKKEEVINEQPRHIKTEFTRIINSKVFKYYSQDKNMNFLESDLFDFLGTSPRSLSTKDRNVFLTRYNSVVKDLIPFCKKISDKNVEARKIIEIWEKLSNEFKGLLNKKTGIKK
tara:strand:+ start:1487 stop:2116 length:630 start_codon:yes stop_codon:yes gene_type:complete